jgi:hypothetical protein
MNKIAKSPEGTNQIAKPEGHRLPIDALATMLDAVTTELEAITHRVHAASQLSDALNAFHDRHPKFTQLDVPAAIDRLNAIRAQFIADNVTLTDILSEPVPKTQLKVLAGALPKIFGKTDVTHEDHWLAGVFALFSCRDLVSESCGVPNIPDDVPKLVSEPISAPVLAKAIVKMLRHATFMPAPSEFYATCLKVRRHVGQLRDEIRRLAALPPPRLPEFPAPKSGCDDEPPWDEFHETDDNVLDPQQP